MLRKIINGLVLLPLAIVLVIFAVANRHSVRVSFDPFDVADPALSLDMPVFVLILGAAILGVAAGGMVTWLRQGRWRRAARRHEADARQARSQLDERKGGRSAAPLQPANALLRPPG